MARRDEILAYADEHLDVASFPEYGPAGAQVLGADEVTKVVCGVSSSRELFERAASAAAQLVLVHHGLFWRNEPLLVDRRMRGRLEALFAATLILGEPRFDFLAGYRWREEFLRTNFPDLARAGSASGELP